MVTFKSHNGRYNLIRHSQKKQNKKKQKKKKKKKQHFPTNIISKKDSGRNC